MKTRLRKQLVCLICSILVLNFTLVTLEIKASTTQTTYPSEDSTTHLRNPGMGWMLYVDFQDKLFDSPAYERPFDDADAYWAEQDANASFANILYIRLPWSQLEPTEGHYAWDHDENYKKLIQGAKDRGLKIALRACVNSIDMYQQATPDYVRQAGAEGYYVTNVMGAEGVISTDAGTSSGDINNIDNGKIDSTWTSSDNTFPKYITSDFGSNSYKLDSIELITNYGQAQGITNVDVESWDGSAWIPFVQNYDITWNKNTDKVEHKNIRFNEVTTSKVRIKVNNANTTMGHFALTEISIRRNVAMWNAYCDNTIFQDKLENFITAFADEYDDPEVVDFIDAMGFGAWGEMHTMKIKGGTYADVYDWLGTTYSQAFDKVLLGTQFGGNDDNAAKDTLVTDDVFDVSRRDAFGSPRWFTQAQKDMILDLFNNGVPVFAENCFHHFVGWKDLWNSHYNTVREMLEGVMADAEQFHANTLDLRVPVDASEWVNNNRDLVDKFNKEGGYRLAPVSTTYPNSIDDNGYVTVEHTWKNTGWGRMPNNRPQWDYKYKVAFALLDRNTGLPVFEKVTDVEPSGWLEGSEFAYRTDISFGEVANGTYDFGVAIVDTTNNNQSAINLGITNTKTNSGWYILGQSTVTGIATTQSLGNKSNMVKNSGFEAGRLPVQTIENWDTWTDTADQDADYSQSYGLSHTGVYHGAHYKATDYRVYTSQLITGLENGQYTLKAWVRSSGGQDESEMNVKENGSVAKSTYITASSDWVEITIQNIQVSNGQCRIGFWTDANAGNWLHFDDVQLLKN